MTFDAIFVIFQIKEIHPVIIGGVCSCCQSLHVCDILNDDDCEKSELQGNILMSPFLIPTGRFIVSPAVFHECANTRAESSMGQTLSEPITNKHTSVSSNR